MLGGTFDPIHIAHVALASGLRESLRLSKILLIPSSTPPHKPGGAEASGSDRLRMIRLALGGVEGLEASDIEIRRDGLSYTLLTLRQLLADYDNIVFIMGADAFALMQTWYEYRSIPALANILVMTRPGYGMPDPAMIFPDKPPAFSRINDANAWRHESGHLLAAVEVPKMDVSSTIIRKMIRDGADASQYLHPKVRDFIELKKLYIQ